MTPFQQAEQSAAAASTMEGARRQLALGDELCQAGRYSDAEVCYRKCIELRPDQPLAHNALGWARQMQQDYVEAIERYRNALQIDPTLRSARRNLATLLVRLGRGEESFSLWHAELQSGGLGWINDLISTALRDRDLRLAGEYAAILSTLRWGSQWYPRHSPQYVPPEPPCTSLTIPKLRHDIDQFLYLQQRGILTDEFTPIIRNYQSVVDQLTPLGLNARLPLDDKMRNLIGHVYNRIVHVRHTPRVREALSPTWNAATVESQYFNHPPGMVVIDNFLSAEALKELCLFCLESTIWSSNQHAHGRLGSQFSNGFNCPLLMQIAEELRERLPRIIGYRYPLRHLWGYKSPPTLPAESSIHADFAAVNVNFWITPSEANLDATSGGLVVYGIEAPLHWNFDMYNVRLNDVIKPFLRRHRTPAITIPYQQNRAIIFNSDLFHGTAKVGFRPGYENRRVNITVLYGDREHDVEHQALAYADPLTDPQRQVSAWRSAAFSSARRFRT